MLVSVCVCVCVCVFVCVYISSFLPCFNVSLVRPIRTCMYVHTHVLSSFIQTHSKANLSPSLRCQPRQANSYMYERTHTCTIRFLTDTFKAHLFSLASMSASSGWPRSFLCLAASSAFFFSCSKRMAAIRSAMIMAFSFSQKGLICTRVCVCVCVCVCVRACVRQQHPLP